MDLCDNPNNGFNGGIEFRSNEESLADLTSQIHQLPCCIKHNGPCAVSQYFKPNKAGVEVEGLDVEEAFFRGRKLEGLRVPVPDGYEGYVLGKKKNQRGKRKDSDSCDDDSNSWETCASFRNITYWNHDSFPSQNDAFLRCFHWFSVAEALHKPVSSEDIAGTTTHGSGKAE
ncbi:hypothetical protein Scep_013479 [Stephania cephalantha]|uniref:Uncharacterized protein n=1 Tax=Stephania cephalantha TaxID=152367 RepID=A0AAP0JID7_9MAGN